MGSKSPDTEAHIPIPGPLSGKGYRAGLLSNRILLHFVLHFMESLEWLQLKRITLQNYVFLRHLLSNTSSLVYYNITNICFFFHAFLRLLSNTSSLVYYNITNICFFFSRFSTTAVKHQQFDILLYNIINICCVFHAFYDIWWQTPTFSMASRERYEVLLGHIPN